MEPKPKERIVFDEDSYYGDEGAEWAVNDLMERKGLTEDEVRESFTDDEVFQHAMKLRDFDYEEEMRALTAFFDGKKSDMSDFINPYGGNHMEAKEAALSRFALPENRKAALDMIRKLNESRDSNENDLF